MSSFQRKNGVFEMNKEDRLARKMIEQLFGLSIEELETLRPLWLKQVEHSDRSVEIQECCNGLIDLVIQCKREELGEDYAENDSCAG